MKTILSKVQLEAHAKATCGALMTSIQYYTDVDLNKDEFPAHDTFRDCILDQLDSTHDLVPNHIPDYLWESVYTYWGKVQTQQANAFHNVTQDLAEKDERAEALEIVQATMKDVTGDLYTLLLSNEMERIRKEMELFDIKEDCLPDEVIKNKKKYFDDGDMESLHTHLVKSTNHFLRRYDVEPVKLKLERGMRGEDLAVALISIPRTNMYSIEGEIKRKLDHELMNIFANIKVAKEYFIKHYSFTELHDFILEAYEIDEAESDEIFVAKETENVELLVDLLVEIAGIDDKIEYRDSKVNSDEDSNEHQEEEFDLEDLEECEGLSQEGEFDTSFVARDPLFQSLIDNLDEDDNADSFDVSYPEMQVIIGVYEDRAVIVKTDQEKRTTVDIVYPKYPKALSKKAPKHIWRKLIKMHVVDLNESQCKSALMSVLDTYDEENTITID